MALTDVKIRNTKPGVKSIKLTDSHGLYLEIRPTGSKLWRYRYRIGGVENVFALGEYSADKSREGYLSLEMARKERDNARELVRKGIHPSHNRRAERLVVHSDNANTFKSVAEDWISENKKNWTPYYLKQIERSMKSDVYPKIGNLPIRQVTSPLILDVLNTVSNRGAPTVALNIKQWCAAIFRKAFSSLMVEHDPVSVLKGKIVRPAVNNAEAMPIEALGVFLVKLEDYGGLRTTTLSIKFLCHTFVRTVEMRRAEWSEIDFERSLWIIPEGKMKKKRPHIVPLSKQSLSVLSELKTITGSGRYLFPNSRRPKDMMSATTVNRAMEYLGVPYSGHDFRATASTNLYEMGYDDRFVEMQLAHAEKNKTKGSYNHAKYLSDRIAMMQVWSDWLDNVWRKAGSKKLVEIA